MVDTLQKVCHDASTQHRLLLQWCIMTTNEYEALRHHAILKGLTL